MIRREAKEGEVDLTHLQVQMVSFLSKLADACKSFEADLSSCGCCSGVSGKVKIGDLTVHYGNLRINDPDDGRTCLYYNDVQVSPDLTLTFNEQCVGINN